MDETLFISDLHLSPERPDIIEKFLRFLRERARKAECIYILGDLFDAWVGDDDDTPTNSTIITALRSVTVSGTKVFIQHGNRDFLLGHRFARETGCQLIQDPTRLNLYGTPTLLMHGDLLCSADIAYQRFRRLARNPLVMRIFLLRSLSARRHQAAAYRWRSNAAIAAKSAASMDVSQDTVAGYMRRFQVQRLIHGHTHRPGWHNFSLDGTQVSRWVLAEWLPQSASVLCVAATGIQVEQLQ